MHLALDKVIVPGIGFINNEIFDFGVTEMNAYILFIIMRWDVGIAK